MAESASPGCVPPATVLGKTMAVLQAFTADDVTLGFAELQRRTGLAKATLHRLLADLVDVRLLDRETVEAPGRGARYRLSGLVFELGMRASVERTLIEVATPYLEDLYERTHETVHLGLRDGAEVVYVAKMGGHRQAAAPSRLGGRNPLHSTALGKALLAHAPADVRAEVLGAPLRRVTRRTVTAPGVLAQQLDGVRAAGVAYEHEESAPGIVCVAAPVLDAGGRVLAAVSVTGPVTRFHPPTHAASVRAAADGIAATLARRSAT